MSFEEDQDSSMEGYDTLLRLARIVEEDDHHSFIKSLLWLLTTCDYFYDEVDPMIEEEV